MFCVVTHPPDPKPALLVETVTRIDEATIAELKRRMISSGCPNGLLFDDRECVIVRDTYTSMDVSSLVEEKRVSTDRLLARVPAGRLEQRVLDWLRSMSAAWNSALPMDGDVAAPFITDIVPAVSGSSVREVA